MLLVVILETPEEKPHTWEVFIPAGQAAPFIQIEPSDTVAISEWVARWAEQTYGFRPRHHRIVGGTGEDIVAYMRVTAEEKRRVSGGKWVPASKVFDREQAMRLFRAFDYRHL